MSRIGKTVLRIRRHKRVRAKIFGTASRPRLSVFRSNRHLVAQIIDDERGHTVVYASDAELAQEKTKPQKEKKRATVESGHAAEARTKPEEKHAAAFEVGAIAAKKAIEAGIREVVFDRGGYRYHGNVKAVAEGARSGGLKF